MTITTFNKIQNAIDKLQEEVAKLDSPSIAILEQLKNNIEQSKGLVTQLRQEKSFKKDFLNTLIDNREDDLLKLLPYYTAETLPHIVQGSGLKIIIKNKELHDLLSKTLRESNYTRELVPFVNKKLKMFMNSNAFNLSWQNRDDIIFTIKIKNLNEQEVFDVLTYLIEGLQSFYNDLINKLKDFVIFSKNINQVSIFRRHISKI